jgi:hypothetical protein
MQDDAALKRVEEKVAGTESLKRVLRKEGVAPAIINTFLSVIKFAKCL